MINSQRELDYLYDGFRLNVRCLQDNVNSLCDVAYENKYENIEIHLKDVLEWADIVKQNQYFIKKLLKKEEII